MTTHDTADYDSAAGLWRRLADSKPCRICGEFKPLEDYARHSAYPDGRDRRCRTCRRAYDKQRYAEHKPRLRAKQAAYKATPQARDALLRREYGITLAEWQLIYNRQAGCCAICEEPLVLQGYRGAHIDHCHASGIVRGILCADCNNGLGMFRDDPLTLTRAALYIVRTVARVEA